MIIRPENILKNSRCLYSAAVVGLLLLICNCGCRKSKTAPSCNTGQSFAIANDNSIIPISAMVGDTIDFEAYEFISNSMLGSGNNYSYLPNALAGCSILWNFGDGSTSTALIPNHVYDSGGTYMVRLTLNDDTAHVIFRSIYIAPVPIYTQLIAGTWNWKHTHVAMQGDTTVSDTTFTVSFINEETVSFGTLTLHYFPLESTLDSPVFWSVGSSFTTLTFSYTTNKILIAMDNSHDLFQSI